MEVISRKNFKFNDKLALSIICSKHFQEKEFFKTSKRKRLKQEGVQITFENYPMYMVSISRTKKKKSKKAEKKQFIKKNACKTK